mgnify:CR=1 FL=1
MRPLKSEPLQSTIEKFLASRAANTQSNYWSAIRSFCVLSGVIRYPDARKLSPAAERFLRQATADDALSYMHTFRKQVAQDGLPIADRSMSHRFKVLRKLYAALMQMQRVKRNPFDDISSLISFHYTAPKRPVRILPFEKVWDVLDCPDPNEKEGIRDRAILALLFGGALRRNEVRRLRLDDVRISMKGQPYIFLRRTKSGRDQEQPLPTWAFERLQLLITQRRAEGASDKDHLFIIYDVRRKHDNEQIGAHVVPRILKRYASEVGLEGYSPKAARSTAATMLACDGHSEFKLAEFLRHANTRQVSVYVKMARGLEENIANTLKFPRKAA